MARILLIDYDLQVLDMMQKALQADRALAKPFSRKEMLEAVGDLFGKNVKLPV